MSVSTPFPSSCLAALRRTRRAFSLVEVVVAVGIFAIAVVALLGILGPTMKSVNDLVDDGIAQRLAENVNLELRRIGLTDVAAALPNANSRIYLVATKDGSRVLITGEDPSNANGNVGTAAAAENNLSTGNPAGIAMRDRYYLVELRRLQSPTYTAGDGAFPLQVRVSWPYRVPAEAPTDATTYNADKSQWVDPSERSVLLFNAAVTH